MLTFDQIIRLVEAGHDVRISPDQSVEIRSGARKTAPLTPAEKQRAYRERQRVTVQDVEVEVTPEPEAVTFVTGVTGVVTDSVTPPSPPSSPPPSPPKPSPSAPTPAPTPTRVLREASADAIYQAYPRKVARPAAIRAIVKALAAPPLGTEPESWPNLLLEITQRFAVARSSEEPQFTPHPSTWFHQRRFEDDPATWKAEAPRAKPGHPPSEAERKEAVRKEAERISKPSSSIKVVPESERVTENDLGELKKKFAPPKPETEQTQIMIPETVETPPSPACDGCVDEMCAQIGCVADIMAEAQQIEDDYLAAGVCSDCGACSLAEANNKCRPKQYQSGEWSCAGEKLWQTTL